MLDLPRYLLGVLELALLAGFATLGAQALRTRLLPTFQGAPAVLATAVLALALLLVAAELLGTLSLFKPVPYLLAVAVAGTATHWVVRTKWVPSNPPAGGAVAGVPHSGGRAERVRADGGGPPRQDPRVTKAPTLVALTITAIALANFALEAKAKLGTGMTGFDSTWYHGPFAAGFLQTGDTWSLHFIAPQFLAWFYPANSEVFHGVGMLAFGRDLLSPLLNVGWFAGCLLACWCVGRPYGVAPWSLALGALALSVPGFADQAGEARNDVVGAFFLLAAVAILLNGCRSFLQGVEESATSPGGGGGGESAAGAPFGVVGVAALAAGLAAGTKLNFLLPAAVLVLGLPFLAPSGARARSLLVALGAALLGGGYWYLRNLGHSGNPLPWVDSLGPISLPSPDQALGGREGHSVLGYLFDAGVWGDWLLPGLSDGLTVPWPLLLGLALAGLALCILPSRPDQALFLTGLAGLATVLAWLVAPTSASGPEGFPRGFESGLRYLIPALALGLTVLPPSLLPRVARWRGSPIAEGAQSASEHIEEGRRDGTRGPEHHGHDSAATGARSATRERRPVAVAVVLAVAVVAIGYPVQRHYLENRYADPSFAAPGLNAAFAWATDVSDSHIATTSTRQYPLLGTDLSNRVDYVGEQRPHGGFVAPATCTQWRRLLNEGDYDYVVASHDRIEPGRPAYPATATWTEGPWAEVVLRQPPTVVFKLSGPLDPSACP